MRGRSRQYKGSGHARKENKTVGDRTKKKPRPQGPVIGSLKSTLPLSSDAAKSLSEQQTALHFDVKDSTNWLMPGEPFFQRRMPQIEALLKDMSTVELSLIPKRRIEVEVRLLNEGDRYNFDRFERALEWMSRYFPDVDPIEFEERSYAVPDTQFRKDFSAEYIVRPGQSYLKAKKMKNFYVQLPSVSNLIPRIGISVEAPDFHFDFKQKESKKTHKKRWSFHVDSTTATKLGLESVRENILSSEGRSAAEIDPLSTITNPVKATIDFTVREANDKLQYSVEIELDDTAIKTFRKETAYIMAGGKRAESEVSILTLSDAQQELLDVWTKLLVTVMNRTGIFLTSQDISNIHRNFNEVLKINASEIPTDIVNQPEDLRETDFSWLSPERSSIFTSSIDLDETDEGKLTALRQYRIFKPVMSIPGGFYVSLKADGTRFFMFLDSTGIYLLNPLSNLLLKVTGKGTLAPYLYGFLPGTIFDVELIGDFEPDGTMDEYQILVFDVLAYSGEDVRMKTYTERLKVIESAIAILNDPAYQNKVSKANESEQSKIAGFVRPVTVLSFSEVFKIQPKPVYRLPCLEDIPTEGPDAPKTEIDRRLYAKALANQFFDILGRVATASTYSSASEDSVVVDGKIMLTQAQNTKGILWFTDGIILTPAERPYLEIHQQAKSLVKKWKQQITIDFRVGRGHDGKLTLLSYSSIEKAEIPFTGGHFPWNGNVEVEENMEGQIVEFAWLYSDRFFDYAFVPLRIRSDKVVGNPMTTVLTLWQYINDPITIDDLSGKSLTWMRRYHNRVKTYLLNELAFKFRHNSGELLDLGSGVGGDLLHWTKFARVYAVEPDIENQREFITRQKGLANLNYQGISTEARSEGASPSTTKAELTGHYARLAAIHARSRAQNPVEDDNKQSAVSTAPDAPTTGVTSSKALNYGKKPMRGGKLVSDTIITPINAKAEDLKDLIPKISKGKVSCVTMFNSLTFIYENKQRIGALLQTISTLLKEGGYFYIIALDGEALLNSMQRPPNDPTDNGSYNTIKTKNIEISKVPHPSCRKVWIKISEGIVRGQYEYLINLREFVHLMDLSGFKLLEERYLDEEPLLSDESFWFSSMFKLLKFRFSLNPAKRELENFLKPLIEKMEADYVIIPREPDDMPEIIRSTYMTSRGVSKLLRYGNPQDGSCYIHAILRAFFAPYKKMTVASRSTFIIQLRKEMSQNYTEAIHNAIGDGYFRTSEVPAYRYENMKASIADPGFWIPQVLMEFIGDQLQTNVYILKGVDAEPYIFGDTASHVKPGRKNVVVYWINDNHYETVGQSESGNTVRTLFPDNHPLITALIR